MTQLLEAVSAVKKRAFVKKMQELLDKRDRMATTAVHRAWGLLEDLRKSVALELTSASGFDAFQLPRLRTALDQLGKDFAAQYQADLAGRIDAAWALGSDAIQQGMQAAEMGAAPFILDTKQLQIAQGLSADLVTKLSAETVAKISTEISRGMLGGQTMFETMRGVTDLLGSKAAIGAKGNLKFVADGIAYRAEMISRTEMLRAYNLANYSRSQDAAQHGVEYHEWVTAGDGRVRQSHADLNGMIVKVGEEFAPGLRFPVDPQGEAEDTINCRCRTIPAFGPEG